MKKVLALYWNHARGIRLFGFTSITFYILAIIARDIVRPIVLKDIVDGLSLHRSSHYLWMQVLLFGVVYLLAQIFFRSGEYTTATFEASHMKNLRSVAMGNMLKHSLGFFTKRPIGALVTKQKRFVNSAEVLFDQIVDRYIGMAVQIIGIITVMAFISVPIMLGIIGWIGFYVLNATIASKKRLQLSYAEAAEESKTTGVFADILGNMSIVKSFGTAKREQARFDAASEQHYRARLTAWRFSNKQSVIQGTFSTIIHIGAISLGIYLWQRSQLTTGDFILISMYAGQLSGMLWGFSGDLRRFNRAIGEAEEMSHIIHKDPEIVDHPNAIQKPDLLPCDASIRFDHVTFGYRKSSPIFTDFNLFIPPGQKVAIIGSTGAGKTTLISLMQRIVDAQQGTIRIGPYDIKNQVTQDGFKSMIGCVTQNIDLFNRTIGENIGYGKPNATSSEIVAAAEKARIHDFIMELPDQYDTMVGEKGVKLSGGQRQRIAIARALVHDAPILVFDEATSSLDNITERDIQQILETGLKDKTVVVIAHRLSTIRNCDRIIVLEHGKIVQDGNHTDLITDIHGVYHRLLRSAEISKKEEFLN